MVDMVTRGQMGRMEQEKEEEVNVMGVLATAVGIRNITVNSGVLQ